MTGVSWWFEPVKRHPTTLETLKALLHMALYRIKQYLQSFRASKGQCLTPNVFHETVTSKSNHQDDWEHDFFHNFYCIKTKNRSFTGIIKRD